MTSEDLNLGAHTTQVASMTNRRGKFSLNRVSYNFFPYDNSNIRLQIDIPSSVLYITDFY